MRRRRIMIGVCCLLAAGLMLISLIGIARADAAPVRTAKQTALHDAAELLRAAGYADDSEPVRALQAAWLREREDLSILARVIDREAGECPWEHRLAVGAVVLNRVASPWFPNTVREVVAAPGQYLESYTYGFDDLRPGSWEAARAVLDGEHAVPADVYWQAQFLQGTSIWWVSRVDTGWWRSTTYFCRGIPGI